MNCTPHPMISMLPDPALTTESGQVGVLVARAWIGLHFFDR
jgi:hypothetical protein